MIKGIVKKPFHGAPDGEIYPRHFNKGDEVHGDLARVAIHEGWAEAVLEKPAKIKSDERGPERPASSLPFRIS